MRRARWRTFVGALLLMAAGPALAQSQPAASQPQITLTPVVPKADAPSSPAQKPPESSTPEYIIQAPHFVLPDPLDQEQFLREEAEKWRFNNLETYLNADKEDKYLRLPEMNTGTTLDQRYLGTLLHPCKINKDHDLTCR
ncbi:hypothetical protein UAJ10_17415 [Nitrospirillum sp. BR 11164]|uniref:hypothetical protein n=1 Tax=Nitrospirillum sp. BR 11164 TaxID=3104324 RepID=UPI002AFF2C61|nr:hypothetical protein [Nitrospirillum sp. BR 11164]MEA1650789.1 hypothetical protein [Nitrospirillum sp. BR 11164]